MSASKKKNSGVREKSTDIAAIRENEIKRSISFAHNLFVSKRNDMIQNSRMNLSLREQKMVLYMLAKVKKGDSPDTEYEFSALEFARAIGLKGKAIYNYEVILNMLKRLADKSWLAVGQDGKEVAIVRWFNTVHMKNQKGGLGVS